MSFRSLVSTWLCLVLVATCFAQPRNGGTPSAQQHGNPAPNGKKNTATIQDSDKSKSNSMGQSAPTQPAQTKPKGDDQNSTSTSSNKGQGDKSRIEQKPRPGVNGTAAGSGSVTGTEGRSKSEVQQELRQQDKSLDGLILGVSLVLMLLLGFSVARLQGLWKLARKNSDGMRKLLHHSDELSGVHERVRHLGAAVEKIDSKLPGSGESFFGRSTSDPRVAELQMLLQQEQERAQSRSAELEALRSSEAKLRAERDATAKFVALSPDHAKYTLRETLSSLAPRLDLWSDAAAKEGVEDAGAYSAMFKSMAREARELVQILDAMGSPTGLDPQRGDTRELIDPLRKVPYWVVDDPQIQGEVALLEACRSQVLTTICKHLRTQPVVPFEGMSFDAALHTEASEVYTSDPGRVGKIESCVQIGFKGITKALVRRYVASPSTSDASPPITSAVPDVPISVQFEPLSTTPDTKSVADSPAQSVTAEFEALASGWKVPDEDHDLHENADEDPTSEAPHLSLDSIFPDKT